ncbi:sensor histidine kinase [Thaumasiovibrio sp. DFM-14]|uniref:sensor histidine kinase n=1 Tax=Thaumasiovibrio sp. DFM-14 TaxID=3384792 RepID=UPI0039A030E2
MKRFLSGSMVIRITLSMIAVIILAEVFAGIVWYSSTSASKKTSAEHAMSAISLAASDTVNYLTDLPTNYRHLVLEQLRNMGGTRFFISMNNQRLNMPSLANHSLVPNMENQAGYYFVNNLKSYQSVDVTITNREDLRLFNSGIKLNEVPTLWKEYSLVLGELDLPIVVIQVQLSEREWLYLATVLPLSFNALTDKFVDGRQLIFLGIATIMLIAVCYTIVQKEVRPFRSLAKSATLMGSKMQVDEIVEEGSNETRAAIHAFNKMNRRIKAYWLDRDMFFRAISHDIKTPLASLKLRTEMLDDEKAKIRFERLLGEVEMMLNGALQCLRDNDIHEELEWIDIQDLLQQCADINNEGQTRVTFTCPDDTKIYGRPLAIKRCIFNLVDNGIKYGRCVNIHVNCEDSATHIIIRDCGPGIDDKLLDKVFTPYFRINNSGVDGSGLGLSISRSIARSHGGNITLSNSPLGGLEVDLLFASIL